jgi:hypothetical protein
MKIRLLLLTVLCVLVVFGLAGCSGSEDQPASQEVAQAPTSAPQSTATPEPAAIPEPTNTPDPAQDPAAVVVSEMVALANAGDYAGAAELVADDFMAYFIGLPPTGMEIYWVKEKFQTFLEQCCTGQHFEWEVTPVKVEDGVVYVDAKTWMDFTRELGVAPNTWTEVYKVVDGKITLYTSTITEEALAVFRPALAAVMPEAFAIPPAGEEEPVSEVTITLANNTCAYDGPMNLKAGQVTVNVDVQDQNWHKYAVSFLTLDQGKDMLDLMAATVGLPPSWTSMPFLRTLTPGQSVTYNNFSVDEGPLYLVCWAGSPDTPIGNAGPFYVMP